MDIGFAPSGIFNGVNILPAGEEDWYNLAICALDTVIAEVRAQRLSPASALNSLLRIYDDAGNILIAEHDDDVGTDSRVEIVSALSDRFNIVVSGSGNSVGYYELDIDVRQGPANTGSDCTVAAQIPTTLSVFEPGAATEGLGTTVTFWTELYDQNGWMIAPNWYDVTWISLNPDVATGPGTIPGTELATFTAQRDGQVVIEAQAAGLQSWAVLTVTDPGAAPANVFDTLAAPAGSFGLNSWGASASDIWTSGMDPGFNYKALWHYDGGSWSMDPNINGTAAAPTGYIFGLWGTDHTDIYASGYPGDFLYYGGTWSVAVPAGQVNDELIGIWAGAPNDVHIAGFNGLYHWDGANWDTLYTDASEDFWGIWGTAANNIWATGASGNMYHYDGSGWAPHTTLSSMYVGIWGAGPDDIWTCGGSSFAHWDGGSWAEEPSPMSNQCFGIWGTSASDIYATSVGGELAHFDGSNWTWAGRNLITPFYASPWGTASSEIWLPGWGHMWRGHRGGSVTLTAGATDILRGDTLHTNATVTDGGGNPLNAPLYYSTSDPGVATVNSAGIITGQGNGTADIIATAVGGAADTIQVSVSALIVEFKNAPAWGDFDSLTLINDPFNFTPGVDYFVQNLRALRDSIPRNAGVVILPSVALGDPVSSDSAVAIQNSAAAQSNLNSWVANGGWLVVHAADNVTAGGYIIPGMLAVVDDTSECFGQTLTQADHPLIRGPDGQLGTADDLDNTKIDFQGYCSDNHGALNGKLPGGALVLMEEGGGSARPTYATYTYGSGRVIITTLTIECCGTLGDAQGRDPQTLINHFWWAFQGSPWASPGPVPPAVAEAEAPRVADPLWDRLRRRR
jgi:hypothetical protein